MNSKNKTSNTLPYSSDSYMQNVSVSYFFLNWTSAFSAILFIFTLASRTQFFSPFSP